MADLHAKNVPPSSAVTTAANERKAGKQGLPPLPKTGISATVLRMSRRFTIEVAKDYFNFASAHFLIFANGKREALHGHNYQVSVAVEGELDRAGIVLDFIAFKPVVKRICDELDHRTLIQKDSSVLKIRRGGDHVTVAYRNQRIVLPTADALLLPIVNTSTELLAEYIAAQIRVRTRHHFPAAKLKVIEVCVEEARGQRGFYKGEF